MRGTHRGARKTGEASFSSLTGQADHTTLSSNALRSGSARSTLWEADSSEVPRSGQEPCPCPGRFQSWNSQQVRQHQGILSRQQGREDQGGQLHQDVQRGQSHHGGLCRLLCQQDQEGQGAQHFPGWGEEGLSDSRAFGSSTKASVRPTTLFTACVPHSLPQSRRVSTTDTYRGAGRTNSASSTRETSSTLAKEDKEAVRRRTAPHLAQPPLPPNVG